MKYEKPSVLALASATQAIQSHDQSKTGAVIDLFTSQEPNPQNSVAAYEADE